MAFKFYIDGQLTDQPVNDTSLVTSIKRDNQLGALLITQDVELIYNGNNLPGSGEVSGYGLIKTLFDSGICNEAEIEVYDEVSATDTVLIYMGIIKIPLVSIDHERVLLKTKIQDNSYYSYIRNNKEIKVNLAAIETKSLIPIDAINKYSVDLYNSYMCIYGSFVPPSGVFFHGYRISDVLAFIIKVITDDKISFSSTFLTSLSSELFLFKGESLLNSYTLYPSSAPLFEVSFQEIFNELDKIYNLVFWIDDTDPNNPIFRIEDYESSFGATEIYSFDDLLGLIQSVDNQNLYAQVNVGSEVITDGTSVEYTWESGRSYYGWKKENFHTLGQCNTKEELNLISEFVLDSNSIQDILILGGTEYIDDYFLIQCDTIDDVLLTSVATQFEFFGDGGCYYNLGVNNIYKMQRHSVKFETSFGNFLGQGTDAFKALLGDNGGSDIIYQVTNPAAPNYIAPNPVGLYVDPSPFSNVTTNGGFDGNNNYDVINFRYTVPAQGNYSFTHQLHLQIAGMFPAEVFDIVNHIKQYDSLSNLITDQFHTVPYGNNGTFYDTVSGVFFCQTGDIIEGSYQINFSRNATIPFPGPDRYLAVIWDSYLECNGTPDSGINIASGNPDVKKYLFEFKYNISQSDFLNIKNNLTQLFAFKKDRITRYGWIYDLQRNDWTGESTIKLITNDAITSE
jgi:hypothetical protein